ncbi:Putative acyl-CoA dehydrogenase [Escherichia coli]|uniref:Acyl-CoA dehydrogenase n=1 Tax=Escherichia coli TaxID=562 RepID=A0A377D4U3_ECOLX|nr:Putative acyl-CoA dehydrogenase [Escherichia coli]
MMRFKSWAVWAIPMRRASLAFWRDVRCERIGGGTDEIMIYVAGRQILKDYQNK